MARTRPDPELPLLDPDVWESPARLSDDDLYAQVGADRRSDGRPPQEQEAER